MALLLRTHSPRFTKRRNVGTKVTLGPYVYVHVYVSVDVHVCTHMYVTCVAKCVSIHVGTCMCDVYTRLKVCMYSVDVCTCPRESKSVSTCASVCTYVCIRVCSYLRIGCVYKCVRAS